MKVRQKKTNHKAVAQFFLILLISFVLGEVVLRVYNYYRPSFIFYSDSYNRFRGKPYGIDWNNKLNSLGFKDKEFPAEKAGAYRIVALGDSFAFGVVPYEYNYLTLVESKLQDQGLDVQVLNMGISSTGPRDYLALLQREGLAYEPDMVLLSFFTGNDFTESRKRGLRDYSYVASLLNYMVSMLTKFEGQPPDHSGDYCDDCPTFGAEVYLDLERLRSRIYAKEDTQFSKLLDQSLDVLNQIKHVCDQRDIKLVVAIIPDEIQVNSELHRDMKQKYDSFASDELWDMTQPNRALAKGLKKAGIDCIDLYDDFAKKSEIRLYKPRDTHWNIAGNELAAKVLMGRIQKYVTPNNTDSRRDARRGG